MKSVSDAYKAGMKLPLRDQSFIKIYFANIDADAADDGEWESNGTLDYSEFPTLDYIFDYQKTIATLELNRWALNGQTIVLPTSGTINDGYVSDKLSDENGEFTASSVMTRQFTDIHSFAGITLTFDTREKEYPKEVSVVFSKNGEAVDEVIVSPTSPKIVVVTSATEVDAVEVTFGDTLPYRRPRLEAVLWGIEKEYTNDDIVTSKQSNDVDPLSRRLPNEQFTFTVLDYGHDYDPDNPEGIYKFVDINSPINVRHGYKLPDGSVEWLKADKYLLNSKPTAKDNQATFTAIGLIGSLTDIFYKGKLGTKNFYDMAVEVLQDANLTPTEQGTDPWEVDESLKQMFTTAVLPIDTHMNCLQLIAHACRCRLFTDDDNIIHLKPFGVTVTGIYNGDFSDNGHAWFSEWGTVNKGNRQGNTYASLELNRWTLDGGEQIIIADLADNPTGRGFASEALSGEDGTFETVPMFTRTFDVSHDLPVVALRFDVPMNEYPTSVTVRYYDSDGLLTSKTLTGINSSEIFVTNDEALDCTKIEVLMDGGLPYRRVRVAKVFYRETDFTLNFDSISEKSQAVSKIDQLKNVTVAKTIYTPESEITDLYEETTTKTQLHVEFEGLASDIQIVVTGGTLLSSTVYGRAADLVLSSGTKTVKIMGTRITESTVVVSYPVASSGETDTEENPLISSDEMSDALAAHVKTYLQMRNTYDADYRGNPELEVGDIIGLQTLYTDEMDALILVDEITFNGSLSGKLKVKGLI